MKDVVAATWGWDETWQRQHFASRFSPETIQIIEVAGAPVGMAETEQRSGEIVVGNLKLLPQVQSRGLGTAVLRGILASAAAGHQLVLLQVLQANVRARRFYERLGFVVTGEVAPHVHMQWPSSRRLRANDR